MSSRRPDGDGEGTQHGILYDRNGSYELAFTVIAVIAALASVFFKLS